MNRKILIVAAHADDEVIGCGGTIARHTAEGDSVHLLILADGVTSRADAVSWDHAGREAASAQALRVLGISGVTQLGLPDNQLDSIPLLQLVHRVEPVIEELRPDIIYTHHHGDLNIDHRIAHEVVMTACRPLPGHPVREIYAFEVVSSTEWNTPFSEPFIPQLFVDISDFLEIKMKAVEAYSQELRPVPHSRSREHIRGLAMHRGSCVGVQAAEAFMVVRIKR